MKTLIVLLTKLKSGQEEIKIEVMIGEELKINMKAVREEIETE